LVDSSPWLIAATHDLHRHLAPRHPPLALCSLKSHSRQVSLGREETRRNKHFFQDARARYAVLKGRAEIHAGLEAAVPRAQAGDITPKCGLYRSCTGPFCLSRSNDSGSFLQNRTVNVEVFGIRWCRRVRPKTTAGVECCSVDPITSDRRRNLTIRMMAQCVP
jgi:hypothetical protein